MVVKLFFFLCLDTNEGPSSSASANASEAQSAATSDTVTSSANVGLVSSAESIKREASHVKLTPSSAGMQPSPVPSQYPVRAPYSSASKYLAPTNGSANPYYSSMGSPASAAGAVGGYQAGYAHPMSQNPQQYGVSMAAQRANPYVQQYSR